MTELQVLSRVLNQNSLALLDNNNITSEYFITYPEEYQYIISHNQEYGNVPDKETFLSKFPEFQIIDVKETDQYLIDTFREEHLYSMTVPFVNKIAELIQTDSRTAVEYVQSELPKLIMNTNNSIGIDIIKDSKSRYEEYKDKSANHDKFFISTGFTELDEIIGGLSTSEELAVIFARTGQGKSWILIKMLQTAWKTGKRIALLEPEMSSNKTGYRFDTLNYNVPNSKLNKGQNIDNYNDYITELSTNETPFYILHPKDFKRNVTVSKLKTYCKSNNIDVLGIDGISYLQDERRQKGDNRSTALTNISEDLMDLSIELGIPVLIVCQSNRDGAKEEDTPDIENIRDSDGIAYNASLILSARQKDGGLQLSVKKNRNGRNGDTLLYWWDIDNGIFKYIPTGKSYSKDQEQIEKTKSEYSDGSEVF